MQVADLFARLTLKPDRKSFDAGDKLLSGIKTALVALAAVKTGEFLTGLIEKTIDAGSAAHDTAIKLGITSQEVQQLQYAAKLSSADIEAVTMATGHMAKGLAEAKTKGTGPFVDGMNLLGISMSEQAIQSGKVLDIHALIANKIKDESIPAWKKQAAAMDLAGRGGLALMPLWAEGADGIKKMADEAVDLGYAMDSDANDALEAMGDDVDRVKMGLTGLRNEAVVALLPELKELVSDVLAWVKANKQLLAQRLAAVLHGIVLALKVLFGFVGFVVDGIRWLNKNFGFLIAVLAGVGLALAAYKAASIGAAIATAVEWALAALPFILLAALITALILIVEDLYTWFEGGDSIFKEFYESVKDWIGNKVMAVINFLIRGINSVIDSIESLMQSLVDLTDNDAFNAALGIAGAGAAAQQVRDTHEKKVHLGRVGELHEGDWSGDPSRQEQIDNMKRRGFVQQPDGSFVPGPNGGTTIDNTVKIDVNVPPGADGHQIGSAITDEISRYFSSQMRRLAGANGGNR